MYTDSPNSHAQSETSRTRREKKGHNDFQIDSYSKGRIQRDCESVWNQSIGVDRANSTQNDPIRRIFTIGGIISQLIKDAHDQLEVAEQQVTAAKERLNHLQSLKTLIEEQCGEDE